MRPNANIGSSGRTFWDLVHTLFSKIKVRNAVIMVFSLIAFMLLLIFLGYLRFQIYDGKVNIELGRKPTNAEIIDENIAGSWTGSLRDIEFDEFKRRLTHRVELRLAITGSSDEIIMKGHLKTYDTLGAFVGEADIEGRGNMERSEFAQISYSLTNKTVRGFGIMMLQIDPSGKRGTGYALYRRTNVQNGRFGLGSVELRRADLEN